MRQIFALCIIALLMIGLVTAVGNDKEKLDKKDNTEEDDNNKNDHPSGPPNYDWSINKECIDEGFDFAIAQWHYIPSDEGQWIEQKVNNYDYGINITGNFHGFIWYSNKPVAGVLTREKEETITHPGGSNGIITKSGQDSMKKVTFCGYSPIIVNPPDPHGVPEFSFATLALAVMIGGLGLAVLRRN